MGLPKNITLSALLLFGLTPLLQAEETTLEKTPNTTNSPSSNLESFELTPEMLQFFAEGFDVQLLLRNRDAGSVASPARPEDETVVGNVTLMLVDGALQIQHIDLYTPKDETHLRQDKKESTQLTPELRQQLETLTNALLDTKGEIQVADNTLLRLDILKMELVLEVDGKAFAVEGKPTHQLLPPASLRRPSGLAKLNSNVYHSRSSGRKDTSYYAGLDSISSWAENHMLFSGSLYGSKSGGTNKRFDKWLYARDFKGMTASAGILNSWNMQSMAQVTTLNAERILGVSLGNHGLSSKSAEGALLVPIIVYLPAAGEAHVVRDGQILSIQRLSMGNHEIDGADLPTGIYNVVINIVIGGQTVSSKTHQVNKPGGRTVPRSLGLQIWGGVMRNSNTRVWQDGYSTTQNKKKSPLYGLSLSGHLSSISWTASLYQNDRTTVQETSAYWQILKPLQLNVQNMYANDGARRLISTMNLQVPGNFMSMWLSYEQGKQGKRLTNWSRDNINLGATLYLSRFYSKAGSLTLGFEKDLKDDKQTTERIEYYQTLYHGRLGYLSMQTGSTRTKSGAYSYGSNRENYISFTFNVPMKADFNVGFSRDRFGDNLDLGVSKGFDSPINYLGIDVSRSMPKQGESRNTYNGYANYDTRYGDGSFSARGTTGSQSYSLSHRGTMAWNSQGVAFGKGSSDSAVIIQLPKDTPTDQLEAQVGNQSFPLKGGDNLLSVSPFETYNVSIHNTGSTDESVNIVGGSAEHTLYPGNVVKIKPEIQKMITVFGRLTTPSGEAISNAKISNHIGFTSSDAEGNFSIDISSETPQLTIESEKTGEFDINFTLPARHQTAIWVGDVVWKGASIEMPLPGIQVDPNQPQF